ncbi:hypothetical protein M885DRAFT_525703 [Pelagophyceae sp. CCMP2097]|nr:hypothetical protein M885DRAFT_525703 [Pelagophyceae sp. CCMP2097]
MAPSRLLVCLCAASVFSLQPARPLKRGGTKLGAAVPSGVVAVVGASGNVGKLVAKRLLDEGYAVRAIVRDEKAADKLREWIGAPVKAPEPSPIDAFLKFLAQEKPTGVAIFPVDVTKRSDDSKLAAALKGAAAVIVCTGTTAFPTAAWAGGGVGAEEVSSVVLEEFRKASFSVAETLSALTKRGMNTPENVDNAGVAAVAACLDEESCKRIVISSSLGVTRRSGFPFVVLDAGGVLSAKAKGEAAIAARSASIPDCDYSVLRPGQLFGGPYTNNYYLGTLFALDKDVDTRAVALQRGDQVAGDTLRSSLAEVLVQTLRCNEAANTDFTVINVKGEEPDAAQIQKQLKDALAA